MPGVLNAQYEGHSGQAGNHRETGRKVSTEKDQFRQSPGGHWWVAALRKIRKYGRGSRRVLQRIVLTTDCCPVDWFLMVTWRTCEDEHHRPSKAYERVTRVRRRTSFMDRLWWWKERHQWQSREFLSGRLEVWSCRQRMEQVWVGWACQEFQKFRLGHVQLEISVWCSSAYGAINLSSYEDLFYVLAPHSNVLIS